MCLPSRVLNAQVLPQVDQAEQVQRVRELEPPAQAVSSDDPPLYSGEEKDTGQQFILEPAPQPRWDWFHLNLDSQYFYTSNAYLTGAGEKGTGLLVSTIQAEVAAPPVAVPYGQLFTRLGYQYQWFDYGLGDAGDDVRRLDFDSATAYAEAQYDLPDQWAVFGNLAYTRLLSDGDGYDEFYKEVVPALRIEKTFDIRQNLNASVEYCGDYRLSDEVPFPDQGRECNNRTDQALDFALTWQVAPKIIISPFYRFQYSYYPDYFAGQSRNDLLNTLGFSANYTFNSWSSIRLFLTYEIRDSDSASVPDYHMLDVGGGVSAGLSF